jgi:hypothetical protein
MKKKIIKFVAKLFGVKIYFPDEHQSYNLVSKNYKLERVRATYEHPEIIDSKYVVGALARGLMDEILKLELIRFKTEDARNPYNNFFLTTAELLIPIEQK